MILSSGADAVTFSRSASTTAACFSRMCLMTNSLPTNILELSLLPHLKKQCGWLTWACLGNGRGTVSNGRLMAESRNHSRTQGHSKNIISRPLQNERRQSWRKRENKEFSPSMVHASILRHNKTTQSPADAKRDANSSVDIYRNNDLSNLSSSNGVTCDSMNSSTAFST